MKILYVVSRPFEINTSASIRNYATVQGLIQNGHDVTILTSCPDKNHPLYDADLELKNVERKYVVLRGKYVLFQAAKKLIIFDKLKSYLYTHIKQHEIYDNLKDMVNYVDNIDVSKYDILISSSDPKSSHLVAERLLMRKEKIRWIQIWGDPFWGDITLLNQKAVKDIQLEENRLLSIADKIIYVSSLTKEQQKNLYPDNAYKMFSYPIPYVGEKRYYLRNLRKASIVELGYCGDYNTNTRNILPLYNAVEHSENIHLTICGMSNLQLQSTSKVTVLSRVSRAKVEEIESYSDILVHLSNRSGTQIPGKIYQYSGTNKPILFILDGNRQRVKKLFEKYARYFFSDNQENDIIQTINHIIKGDINIILSEPVIDFAPEVIAKDILI